MQSQRRLTPNDLRLVQRFGASAGAIASYLASERRFHATMNSNATITPDMEADGIVERYESATAADVDHCQASIDRLARELGIAR